MNLKLATQDSVFQARRLSVWVFSLRLGLILLPILARAEIFGDISITAEAMYSGNTFHGYAETRVILENQSSSKFHQVTLTYPNNPYGGYGNAISRLSRTLTLAPGAHEIASLFQPPLPINGDGQIHLDVDGRPEGEIRAPNVNAHAGYYGYGSTPPGVVLVSRSLNFDDLQEHVFGTNVTSSGSRSGGSAMDAETLRAESPASAWSVNWLAYTPFDAIALTTADLNSMPGGGLSALENYVRAGGNLFIIGNNAPSGWHFPSKISFEDGVQYRSGFGNCFVVAARPFSTLSLGTVELLRDTAARSARYWQSLPADAGAANAVLHVVENLKVPVRGIVGIMLLFIIVIGPVNIFYLRRIQRRTWMLWTIPAISAVTTLVIFVYSLLAEGITPDTRIMGVTVLDQVTHSAATIGGTAFYCPLTPRGGLRFELETEVTPLVRGHYGDSSQRREIDWSQMQHLDNGWVSARIPACFHVRKSETRRERLQLVNENGVLAVINGLGAPINSLWLADASGKIYHAGHIGAGQKSKLEPGPVAHIYEQLGVNEMLEYVGFTGSQNDVADRAERYLSASTYIARLDGNPFIENALGSVSRPKRTLISSVVFGFLDPLDAP